MFDPTSKGFVKQPDGSYSKVSPKNAPGVNCEAKKAVPVVDLTPNISKAVLRLNKTERAFYDYLLSNPEHSKVRVQPIGLVIGNDCRYHCDFTSIYKGRFCLWEVKGFMQDDALVKLKVIAREWNEFDLYLVKKEKSGWNIEKLLP